MNFFIVYLPSLILESKNKDFDSLKEGELVTTDVMPLLKRDDPGEYSFADSHDKDYFIVIEIQNGEARLINNKTYNKIVKFLHLRGFNEFKEDVLDRDYPVSIDDIEGLEKESNVECDGIYYFNPDTKFCHKGYVKDNYLLKGVRKVVNVLIDRRLVYNNKLIKYRRQARTVEGRGQIEKEHIKGRFYKHKTNFNYLSLDKEFNAIVDFDNGSHFSGNLYYKNFTCRFQYVEMDCEFYLYDKNLDSTTLVYLNNDNSYDICYNDDGPRKKILLGILVYMFDLIRAYWKYVEINGDNIYID